MGVIIVENSRKTEKDQRDEESGDIYNFLKHLNHPWDRQNRISLSYISGTNISIQHIQLNYTKELHSGEGDKISAEYLKSSIYFVM